MWHFPTSVSDQKTGGQPIFDWLRDQMEMEFRQQLPNIQPFGQTEPAPDMYHKRHPGSFGIKSCRFLLNWPAEVRNSPINLRGTKAHKGCMLRLWIRTGLRVVGTLSAEDDKTGKEFSVFWRVALSQQFLSWLLASIGLIGPSHGAYVLAISSLEPRSWPLPYHPNNWQLECPPLLIFFPFPDLLSGREGDGLWLPILENSPLALCRQVSQLTAKLTSGSQLAAELTSGLQPTADLTTAGRSLLLKWLQQVAADCWND